MAGSASRLANSSFAISPDMSQIPLPFFSTSSVAFVASLRSDDGAHVYLGAYDGIPGEAGDEKGTQIILGNGISGLSSDRGLRDSLIGEFTGLVG